jgi:hypothetical protein
MTPVATPPVESAGPTKAAEPRIISVVKSATSVEPVGSST